MPALREIQQHQQPSTSQALQPRQKTKNSPSLGLPGSTSSGLKMVSFCKLKKQELA